MNLFRFLKKALTDRPAAWCSAKLVGRELYGKLYWFFNPDKPLSHHLSTGGVLLLEPLHSFTHCFYPGVDQYEPEVRGALKRLLKAGDTFIDCGANIGYFSVVAGHLVGNRGKVIAIEANPITYSLLDRNLKINHLGISIHCALTSRPGEVELFVPLDGGDVYSSLKEGGLVQGSVQSFRVHSKTLDDIVKEKNISKVDLVKIDIEGAELDVLNSASSLLSILRPIFIIEYGTNTWVKFEATPEKLQEIVQKYSYYIRLFKCQTNHFIPISEKVWSSPYTNLVLIPSEKIEQLFEE